MQDIAVQFEKHCWIHSVSLFPPQVHVGRSPINISILTIIYYFFTIIIFLHFNNVKCYYIYIV
ncbi:hypothetical protein [Spiroplasma endosymbiont of Apeira syringaria]|uniref:hypothetical protein n=1 Tax=Spiroplasma endosymbiont of Apeira syringaria TaxID=3066307 RepID=UPI0030D573D9